MGREEHAVDAGRLGAAQQRPDVLRILERVQGQHERRLVALGRPGKDVLERRELARLDDQGHPLVAIEAGKRRERAALELDDRQAQARRVEDQLLERLPTLRDDEQSMCRPTGDERLLDRAAAGDQLLVLAEDVRRRQGRRGVRRALRRPHRATRPGPRGRPSADGPAWTRSVTGSRAADRGQVARASRRGRSAR